MVKVGNEANMLGGQPQDRGLPCGEIGCAKAYF